MSRNLGKTECSWCGGVVQKTGADRQIVRSDCGVYFSKYQGMIVADAACLDCEAPYLAWLDGSARPRPDGPYDIRYPSPRLEDGELTIRDLSHASTFNDEPGEIDYPKWQMVRTRAPWPTCEVCAGPLISTFDGAPCDRDRTHKVVRCTEHDDCKLDKALALACYRARVDARTALQVSDAQTAKGSQR